ncbi:hypothetical protein D3C72_1954920 [compost metagenome]
MQAYLLYCGVNQPIDLTEVDSQGGRRQSCLYCSTLLLVHADGDDPDLRDVLKRQQGGCDRLFGVINNVKRVATFCIEYHAAWLFFDLYLSQG